MAVKIIMVVIQVCRKAISLLKLEGNIMVSSCKVVFLMQAQCALWYAELKLIVTVQSNFLMYMRNRNETSKALSII